ncbi:MAG TPA: isocitrate lyase/phosphoenolpyruvate mutase family protein [Acidimicrobiia bacterium]|jgi:2-methylisocitrate lyase-like PEP mutase family enzyme|nr:isocitrate lyase/phosphoenolpyruvate mutase family protein [Acidimicrobiia bacterium]
MPDHAETCATFLALHHGETPLLLPNAWDRGTAKLFEFLGFSAVATTSSGHAATLGRLDGAVTLDEVVAHAADLVGASDLPLNVDFENGFADEPDSVAANVVRIAATGAAGVSIEDFNRRADAPIYDIGLAAARVEAAAQAAHGGSARLVLTARAENYLHGNPDLDDTIARLQAYQAAGADVLYAPGLSDLDSIRAVVSSVDRPVNVLALPNVAPVAELAAAGVRRVSVGGGFNRVALGATIDAAREFLDEGTYGFWRVAASAGPAREAFA